MESNKFLLHTIHAGSARRRFIQVRHSMAAPRGVETNRCSLEPFVPSSPPRRSSGHLLPPPSQESSKFRLSLSLDGKAEVVPMSSPPHSIALPPSVDDLQSLGPVRRLSLQRSHSASSPVVLPPISVLTNSLVSPSSGPLPPRLTRGRSRDPHAWEYACDSENRDDLLTLQAKHESSGSAIAAITLLRSTSSTGNPLQPSSSAKRNAAASRAAPRSGLAKKPKLSRALSSAAKLQSNPRLHENGDSEKDAEADSGKMKVLVPSGNDSDKENWSPDKDRDPHFTFSHTQVGAASNSRKPLPFGATRLDKKNPRRTPGRFGQEHRGSASLLGSRANTAPGFSHTSRAGKRGQSPLEIFEDTERTSPDRRSPAVDDEVERFMRGEVSPSKKGDVDAVAGLLSLSQGNWR